MYTFLQEYLVVGCQGNPVKILCIYPHIHRSKDPVVHHNSVLRDAGSV